LKNTFFSVQKKSQKTYRVFTEQIIPLSLSLSNLFTENLSKKHFHVVVANLSLSQISSLETKSS